jgi:hypothetical protein
METRKGEVIELYEEHDGWQFTIEVLVPASNYSQVTIVLPGQEIDLDRLFSEKGDPQYEETQELPTQWVKEKPPFAIGDEVSVRFT